MACEIFNVGKYRRQVQAKEITQRDESNSLNRRNVGACDANFFNSDNLAARKLRTKAASMAMKGKPLIGGDAAVVLV